MFENIRKRIPARFSFPEQTSSSKVELNRAEFRFGKVNRENFLETIRRVRRKEASFLKDEIRFVNVKRIHEGRIPGRETNRRHDPRKIELFSKKII